MLNVVLSTLLASESFTSFLLLEGLIVSKDLLWHSMEYKLGNGCDLHFGMTIGVQKCLLRCYFHSSIILSLTGMPRYMTIGVGQNGGGVQRRFYLTRRKPKGGD